MEESEAAQKSMAAPVWAKLFAILLTLVTVGAAVFVWGDTRNWNINNSYQLFPLFGLAAFSIMWCHYVVAAVLRLSGQSLSMQRYFRITGYAVLVLILLHPGLLIYQLWADGRGLPPDSYVSYVGEASKIAVILGFVALICFLLYETKRFLSKTPVWPYIVALSDIAMILIFVHGLRLGSNIQSGWYRTLWLFYGVVLVPCIVQRVISSNSKSRSQTTAE